MDPKEEALFDKWQESVGNYYDFIRSGGRIRRPAGISLGELHDNKENAQKAYLDCLSPSKLYEANKWIKMMEEHRKVVGDNI